MGAGIAIAFVIQRAEVFFVLSPLDVDAAMGTMMVRLVSRLKMRSSLMAFPICMASSGFSGFASRQAALSGFLRRRAEKKGRRLSPAALPEEALVNVLSPSTHLSQAAGAAKPVIPVLAEGEGGVDGGNAVHDKDTV